ncbi:MAG: xanthine dehydrogenase family protein subunit M [Proteobacteria bacterium]|nr:xanthine dehydrogenase family protein subunit M [Pseudomonadota bacterium]
MKPAPFDYVRAESVHHAVRLLAENKDGARIIAGGQSLMTAMNFRMSSPALLVDIGELEHLRDITLTADARLRIGALTRHADLDASPDIAAHTPLLRKAIRHVAHTAIRNRGTFGGSLSHADPASELPACVMALDATIHIVGPDGDRVVPARHFFTGVHETALGAGEVLVAVELDVIKADEVSGFGEFARRQGDYAMVGLAAHGRIAAGLLTAVDLAFFAVGSTPILARRAAAALVDPATPDPAQRLQRAREALSLDLDPPDDPQSSAAMRMELARVLLGRVVGDMLARGAGA